MKPVSSRDQPPDQYRRGLHVAAVATACFVLPLVFVGAGVTSKGAGMAYPDWPTSGGHLVDPPNWWQQDHTRWEHGHRLLGWVVGMSAIVVASLSWRRGGGMRAIGLATLLAIIVQGVLGGLRVTEISTGLAMVHGIWGQVCFCLACAGAMMSSRVWVDHRDRFEARAAGFLKRLCLVGSAAIFVQLILGAALRHFGSDAALVAHILWAVLVALLVGWLAMWVIGLFPAGHAGQRLGWIMGGLMVTQLMLGGLALAVTLTGGGWSPLMRWAVPSAHVVVGALLFACSVLLTASCHRMLRACEGETVSASSPVVGTS